jgi:hypothetical protein
VLLNNGVSTTGKIGNVVDQWCFNNGEKKIKKDE